MYTFVFDSFKTILTSYRLKMFCQHKSQLYSSASTSCLFPNYGVVANRTSFGPAQVERNDGGKPAAAFNFYPLFFSLIRHISLWHLIQIWKSLNAYLDVTGVALLYTKKLLEWRPQDPFVFLYPCETRLNSPKFSLNSYSTCVARKSTYAYVAMNCFRQKYKIYP